MSSVWTTKVKKLNPKKGYTAAYIQLPWNTHEDLIGREVEIEEVVGGFLVKVDCEKFKLEQPINPNERLLSLEKEFHEFEALMAAELFQNDDKIENQSSPEQIRTAVPRSSVSDA